MLALPEECAAHAVVRHARASGRVRLEIPALLHDPDLATRIEASVRARAGVTRVHASPTTARVLIELARDAPLLAELEAVARPAARPRRGAHGAPARTTRAWHAMPAPAVLEALDTTRSTGLDPAAAARRLDEVGANVIEDEAPPSRLALLGRQLSNLPTALLLGSTVVSLLLGDVIEAGAIVFVIGLNAAIGYRVERTSEDLLAAWRTAELGTADVIRGGSLETVAVIDLVPGDVLVVRAGDVLGADARVIDAHRLAVDEAALTGESEPVTKSLEPVAERAALADRRSMLYRGTTVASGRGRAVVVATGGGTELAAVQRLAAASRAPKGGLQRRLDALTSKLAWSGIAASMSSAVASIAWRQRPLDVLRDTVALAVAAIPEGLPVTATSSLVRAMARMRARGVIVRRLGVAETLGGVTVACTDKTGTLTENQMRLESITILDAGRPRRFSMETLVALDGAVVHGPLGAVLVAGVLNSDIDYHHNGGTLELAGSSTERALVGAAQDIGLDPRALRARWTRRRLRERGNGVHYVISEHAAGFEVIKGAPEQVAPLCALADADVAAVLAENEALAGDGLRVLAVGWRAHRAPRWRFGGLVGLRDPLRAGSADAVRAAARAGIRTLVVTGDQRATAAAIARAVGLTGEVIEGHDLASVLAAPDAAARLRGISVIARVTPEDKVAVVEALRAHGEVVAMAGDGINDAPALRAADVGIAVGAGSTDLARQTADIVLEHADLRSILTAVSEGRAVQDNLRRAIRFQVATNVGELLLLVGASLVGRRLIPSLGLLWINLITDTVPGLALALEPPDGALLDRPPAPPGAPILDPRDWRIVGRDGAILAAGAGVAAVFGGPVAAFATIGASQFGYAATCRAPGSRHARLIGALLGGSAVAHLVAVASTPLRTMLRISGSPQVALASFAASLTAPLYVVWRREAGREITRCGPAAPSKEMTP